MSATLTTQETSTPPESWVFEIGGMDCADCARTVEVGVGRLPGVANATMNFGAATLTVVPEPGLTPEAVTRSVAAAGYVAKARASSREGASLHWWQQRRTSELAIAALLWLAGFVLDHQTEQTATSAIVYPAAMCLAGYPIFRAAWFALKNRRADMHLLMTIAAIGAVAIGEFSEAASVTILFAIGIQLQALAIERTRSSIRSLMSLAPDVANVVRDGETLTVAVADVVPGEIVLIRPGERVPVDGIVHEGLSAIDQSSMTGESTPVSVEPGSRVLAGTMNGDGMLRVTSTSSAADTTLAHVIALVDDAESKRAPAQAFVDRFAAIYTPLVVLIAIALATIVPLLVGDYETWFYRALVLLVVACPCALVISTPVALISAIGAGSRRGVLFKGGAAIESLADVETVAFDKTGTLTTGHPTVERVISLGKLSEDELLAVAAAVDRDATHPIARGIVRAAAQRHLHLPETSNSISTPGQGAASFIDGEQIRVGSRRFLADLDTSEVDGLLRSESGNLVLIANERLLGVIVLNDPLRTTSAETVAELHDLGLKTVMLSGDLPVVAERIASSAGVMEVHAGLLPGDKLEIIADLEAGAPVAMIGDGINDAPALTRASVGIAMGVSGADIAIEAADVALMRDDISQLPAAVSLSRRTMRTIHWNIAISLLVKLVFLVLTVGGITNLWLAVLADTGTSLLVTLNSLRLLRTSA